MNPPATLPSHDAATPDSKRTERVMLETATHLITGTVTLPVEGYGARFSDYLNRQDFDYLALTDVEKRPLAGGAATTHGFCAVARRAVLYGYPVDE